MKAKRFITTSFFSRKYLKGNFKRELQISQEKVYKTSSEKLFILLEMLPFLPGNFAQNFTPASQARSLQHFWHRWTHWKRWSRGAGEASVSSVLQAPHLLPQTLAEVGSPLKKWDQLGPKKGNSTGVSGGMHHSPNH